MWSVALIIYHCNKYRANTSRESSEDILHQQHIPNVVVEWLVILLLILEVPGSNFGSEIGYLD
jgi:hypothetical protein